MSNTFSSRPSLDTGSLQPPATLRGITGRPALPHRLIRVCLYSVSELELPECQLACVAKQHGAERLGYASGSVGLPLTLHTAARGLLKFKGMKRRQPFLGKQPLSHAQQPHTAGGCTGHQGHRTCPLRQSPAGRCCAQEAAAPPQGQAWAEGQWKSHPRASPRSCIPAFQPQARCAATQLPTAGPTFTGELQPAPASLQHTRPCWHPHGHDATHTHSGGEEPRGTGPGPCSPPLYRTGGDGRGGVPHRARTE